MAFFFEDGDTLYGRHWGSDANYDSLHFELCYYQGIDRCFARRLAHFDAGVQGGHKLARGFETELAHSAHWFEHTGFQAAIERRSEEHTSELQSLMRISYAVFCLKKKDYSNIDLFIKILLLTFY